MKPFNKTEKITLIIIFLILICVSIPNFMLSIRRERDQGRRDVLGMMENVLSQYITDIGNIPASTEDGKILACLKPGTAPKKGPKNTWIIDFVPCDWGKDGLVNVLTGKIILDRLPTDPNVNKGALMRYFSDGENYQIYAAMEGLDEAEVDPKIIARNISCGQYICNTGRSSGVPLDISLAEYNRLLLIKK